MTKRPNADQKHDPERPAPPHRSPDIEAIRGKSSPEFGVITFGRANSVNLTAFIFFSGRLINGHPNRPPRVARPARRGPRIRGGVPEVVWLQWWSGSSGVWNTSDWEYSFCM
jgi:hypothetical protein